MKVRQSMAILAILFACSGIGAVCGEPPSSGSPTAGTATTAPDQPETTGKPVPAATIQSDVMSFDEFPVLWLGGSFDSDGDGVGDMPLRDAALSVSPSSHDASGRLPDTGETRMLFVTECLKSRLHVRGQTQFLLSDPQYPGLYDTPLTPHFDTAVDPCHSGICDCDDKFPPFVYRTHIVHTDDFTAARNRLEYEWVVANGAHFILDSQMWNNTTLRHQCNGENAVSDGTVDMLAACADFPGRC